MSLRLILKFKSSFAFQKEVLSAETISEVYSILYFSFDMNSAL